MTVEVKNIVESLFCRNAGKVLGIAGVVSGNKNNRETIINDDGSIKYSYYYTNAVVEDGTTTADKNYRVSSCPKIDANSVYLHYGVNTSTVANVNRSRNICVSSNYSGCIYSVYNTRNGIFKCIHTSRESSSDNTCIDRLRQYAAANNWQLVHEIETRDLRAGDGQVLVGVSTGGYIGTYIVTQASYYSHQGNTVVRTVRIRHNAQFNTVIATLWEKRVP